MSTIITAPVDEQPWVLWDTRWRQDVEYPSYGDWTVDSDEYKGLVAKGALHTAVVLCLFTDVRAEDTDDLPGSDDDRRGWFGDYIDIRDEFSEGPMGSRIWLYERSALTDEVAQEIRDAAEESLQPLISQGLASAVEVDQEHDKVNGWLYLSVRIYSETNELKYDQKFSRLWRQVADGF